MRLEYWAVGLAFELTVVPSSALIYCSLEADVIAWSIAISSCFYPFDLKIQMKKDCN